MVMGEVTSCLHLNIPVGPATGFCKCVSQLVVAGYYISTTLAGEYTMAKGSSIQGNNLSHLRCLGPATTSWPPGTLRA